MSGNRGIRSLQRAQSASSRLSMHDAALQSQLAAIIEATPDGVALLDPQGNFHYVNPACRSLLAIELDESLFSLTLLDFCPELFRLSMEQNVLPTVAREGRWSAETELRTRRGHRFPVLLTLFAHKEPQAPVSLLSLILRDISEQKRREAELAYLAHHDALTGLFNRRRFQEELESRLAHARRYGTQGALLFIDVDGLKGINDTLGHPAGDAFLQNLATLLKERLREVDVIARLGGDEFAVLLSTPDARQASAVAERLLQAVRTHTTMAADVSLQCTMSLGIALFPEHGGKAETLIERADLALYRAKAGGKDQCRMFSPEMKP